MEKIENYSEAEKMAKSNLERDGEIPAVELLDCGLSVIQDQKEAFIAFGKYRLTSPGKFPKFEDAKRFVEESNFDYEIIMNLIWAINSSLKEFRENEPKDQK